MTHTTQTLSNGKVIVKLVVKGDRDFASILPGGKYAPIFINPTLTKTGEFGGDVALIGTNGLTIGSYSSSSIWDSRYIPSAGFDGYLYSVGGVMNSSAGTREGDGSWLSHNTAFDSGGLNGDENLTIDFGQAVKITGFRLFSFWLGSRTPNTFDIEGSIDGVTFTTIESFVSVDPGNRDIVGQEFTFAQETYQYQHYRIRVYSTWGARYCEIDALEIYTA